MLSFTGAYGEVLLTVQPQGKNSDIPEWADVPAAHPQGSGHGLLAGRHVWVQFQAELSGPGVRWDGSLYGSGASFCR